MKKREVIQRLRAALEMLLEADADRERCRQLGQPYNDLVQIQLPMRNTIRRILAETDGRCAG